MYRFLIKIHPRAATSLRLPPQVTSNFLQVADRHTVLPIFEGWKIGVKRMKGWLPLWLQFRYSPRKRMQKAGATRYGVVHSSARSLRDEVSSSIHFYYRLSSIEIFRTDDRDWEEESFYTINWKIVIGFSIRIDDENNSCSKIIWY